jgi:hypothetical protein
MEIVEYYEQVVQTMRPLDDELVLLDLGDGRYCAFGERVSSRAQYAHKQRTEALRKPSQQIHNTTMSTNRPGFFCYFVCGDEGLAFVSDCEAWYVRLVEPSPAMRPAIDRLWESIMSGHPKFKWFVPRAVAQGEVVQLRLF